MLIEFYKYFLGILFRTIFSTVRNEFEIHHQWLNLYRFFMRCWQFYGSCLKHNFLNKSFMVVVVVKLSTLRVCLYTKYRFRFLPRLRCYVNPVKLLYHRDMSMIELNEKVRLMITPNYHLMWFIISETRQ